MASELIDRVEALAAELAAVSDPRARAAADAMISAVLEMHGEGLQRILELIDEAGAVALRDSIVRDGVVASLLLIHDLYPVGIEERVLAALEPFGEGAALMGLHDGVARLRVSGGMAVEHAARRAVHEAAPDLEAIEVEGTAAPVETSDAALAHLDSTVAAATAGQTWVPVGGVATIPEGSLVGVKVEGETLVVASVGGTLTAYLDECTGCEAPLSAGRLDGPALVCRRCAREYDLPRAGRSTDGLQLQAVPLLRSAGGEVRVAVGR